MSPPTKTIKCALPTCTTRLAVPVQSVFCSECRQQLPFGIRTQVDELCAMAPGEESTKQAIDAACAAIYQEREFNQDPEAGRKRRRG